MGFPTGSIGETLAAWGNLGEHVWGTDVVFWWVSGEAGEAPTIGLVLK